MLLSNGFVSSSINIFDDRNNSLISIDSVSAAFGPKLPDDGFQGYITLANPIGACSKIEKPLNVSFVDPDKWIVLIQRTPTIFGNCSFDLKVYNAQQAGFKAVIIYNSESDNLIKMSSSGLYKIKIPSVFIGHSSGIDIASYFTYANKTYVIITDDDTDLNYLLLPFICVVTICFIIAISIFVAKFALHIYKLRKNRFPKSALKKIPTKKYQKTDKYDTCPICLNEYEEGDKMRILPCEHAYHVECIDKWLLRNNRFCPVCKRRVLPGGSDSENEDNENQTSTAQINHPNEDEDTNESSRLLVNVRDSNFNDDNLSSATISTTLNANINLISADNLPTNNQLNTDLSSLNNQMTVSMTSSQAPLSQNKDLRSSSSRYGSISSIANATTSKSEETCEHLKYDAESDNSKDFIRHVKNSKLLSEHQIDKKNKPLKKSHSLRKSSRLRTENDSKLELDTKQTDSIKIENESGSKSNDNSENESLQDDQVALIHSSKSKAKRSKRKLGHPQLNSQNMKPDNNDNENDSNII